MCITGADIRSEEEPMVWDILCHEYAAKAERLLDEQGAQRLFDISMEEDDFCPESLGRINGRFVESYDLARDERPCCPQIL